MRRGVMMAGIWVAVCACAVHAEQTLESVEQNAEALWAKIGGFKAKVSIDTTVSMGPVSLASHAAGTIECAKQGDTTLFRLELVNKTQMPLVGPVEQKMTSVFDGKEMINDVEAMGQRQALRMPHGAGSEKGPAGGRAMFEEFRGQGPVTLLPDATVDGKPVWVVEVKPDEAIKRSAPTPVALFRYYISKEYGIRVKTEVFDDKGQPTSTTVYNEIDANAEMGPDRFVYKAPPGVTIQDMPVLKLPGK